MKRYLIAAVLIIMLMPAISHARRDKAPPISPSTPRQFMSSLVMPGAGNVTITLVATAADEGRAKGAMSQALADGQQKAGEAMDMARTILPRTPTALGDWLWGVIERCRTFSGLTRGAFDITSGAEGFAFVKRDWRRLKLNKKDKTLTIKSDEVKIDPTTFGLALRGFIADDIMESLRKQGWSNVQVKGGNVTRNIGRDIHTPWTISLQARTKAEMQKYAYRATNLSVTNVGTAEISPVLFPQGIVDPRAHTVVTDPDVINTIIFAADAATASAYAIATYANSATSAEQGLRFVSQHPEIKGIIVKPDGTMLASAGLGIKRPSLANTTGSTTQSESTTQ